MGINITLIIGIILLILGIKLGYDTGFVKGIANVISLFVTLITLALIIMLTASFREGETRNVTYTLIIMIVLGGIYTVVKFVVRSFKAISKLPVIKFADSILGIIIGVVWSFLLYIGIIMLGMNNCLWGLSDIIQKDVDANQFLTTLCKYNIFL